MIPVEEWLREDAPYGDITSELLIPPDLEGYGEIISRGKYVLCGIHHVAEVFAGCGVEFTPLFHDGDDVEEGDAVAGLRGNIRAMLLRERLALNILGHMTGIATATRRAVEIAERYGVRVAATRKTTPGLRALEKYAVSVGGGDTHRLTLSDHVLIKDNHIRAVGSLERALSCARNRSFVRKVEVEVETVEDALAAARMGADILMLDNFTPEMVRRTLDALKEEGLKERVIVEVSGGITMENLEEYASLRPDVISMGCLTHSVRVADFSLELR